MVLGDLWISVVNSVELQIQEDVVENEINCGSSECWEYLVQLHWCSVCDPAN
jgi:hypothetical protein